MFVWKMSSMKTWLITVTTIKLIHTWVLVTTTNKQKSEICTNQISLPVTADWCVFLLAFDVMFCLSLIWLVWGCFVPYFDFFFLVKLGVFSSGLFSSCSKPTTTLWSSKRKSRAWSRGTEPVLGLFGPSNTPSISFVV